MSIKPITLFYSVWCIASKIKIKIAILLEELAVPYELSLVTYKELKEEPYTSLTPNGRSPAIEDPNTGYKVWETGAIIEYLIDYYDKEEKFHYASGPEKYQTKQWLYFQVSGQGPYFGQAAYFQQSLFLTEIYDCILSNGRTRFNMFHHEKLLGAQERYMKEVHRVVGVLNSHLSKSTSGWLVGDRITYADLAFVTWNNAIAAVFSPFPGRWDATKYPFFQKWHEALLARPTVQKALADQQKLSDKFGEPIRD
ncbi:Glutathione S-transferase-like protein [Lachnellula willkommii]|uniref:Glutathione S-transferase-like protein n=1 Tax=Lachnellula willkommii TaxID=215461 RepID=A0A559MGZ7_9HELO|nr:Glutathione S-transferase-like protein [Lachnellula willkommii]